MNTDDKKEPQIFNRVNQFVEKPIPDTDVDKQLDNVLSDLVIECQQFGATPEQFGFPPDIHSAKQSLHQLIQEQRLEDIYFVMDSWHGKTDKEFAKIMNDRINSLEENRR